MRATAKTLNHGPRPTRPLRRPRVWTRLAMIAALIALALPVVGAPTARADSTITVNTLNQEVNGDGFCSLQEAIHAANLDDNVAPDASNPGQLFDTACPGGSGHDTIELPSMGVFQFADPMSEYANFMGPTATPMITSHITIEGRGARLERLPAGRATRLFAVAPAGFLDLREVHVKGFFIHGGNGGGGGGGGGMGAGGAIYVQGGELLVQWSTFEGNGVHGGNGGNENAGDGGGGGGGLSGNGGSGSHSAGGGGGSRGNGGNGRDSGIDHWGGGGGGTVTSGSNETPGESCGGAGGESFFGEGGNGSGAECAGGGGGGGSGSDDILKGHGASGAYGGGGGGGGAGFETFSSGNGQGGTFAGDGDRAGGGGAGLGGAIFGYLADIHVSNSTFSTNQAERGQPGVACGLDSCGAGGNGGRAAGGAIFTVAGDLRVESSTFSNNQTGEWTLQSDGSIRGIGGGAIVAYKPESDGNPATSEETTLLLRNSILAGNGPWECYTRNGVDMAGSATNIITDNTTNSSGNPACLGLLTSEDPALGTLAINAPGRTPTMAIGPGSVAYDAATGASPADDQRGILRPQAQASDIGAYELASTPPVTTVALSPASPNGSNGWFTSPVGVTVAPTDPDGTEIAETRCVLDPVTVPATFADLPDVACAITSVSTDGEHVIYAASVDANGNVETALAGWSFKIDQTDPALAPTLDASVVEIGQTGVEASANATDATSGVASSSCDPVDTTTPGVKTVTCYATDNAGNTASADLDYVVEYRILGFFSPVPASKWKVAQTIPVKLALANGAGARISDAEAAALARACRVTFQATGAQTKGPVCLKYDPEYDQFIYNWKLGKTGTGTTVISVSISYPDTTFRTTLSETVQIMR